MTFESNRFLHKKECREQTLKQVTVFNDRAELKRIISCNTNPGFNEIHIQNVTHYIVPDSVRVDGRGVGIIHSVEVQDKPATYEETDSPKLAQLRARYQEKLHEINVMKDREAILQKRIQALDKMVLEIGTNVCKTPNTREPFFPSKEALDSLTNFYNFYDESALAVRAEQRDLVNNIEKESRELDVLLLELNKMETDWNAHRQKKTIIVGVESDKGGLIELEVSYQIYGARWYPSYDIRVKTSSNSLTISYFGNISQSTGEDWSNSTLVLSSAQPCHGDQIPDLGALEAVFYRPSPSPRAITHYKAKTSSAFSQSFQDSDALCLSSLEHAVACVVPNEQNLLSTEFMIAKPTTIPSDGTEHKVTIGIVDVIPQLIHQCVPSKNTNVFLIAYATNTSSFPFLRGDAAVYLNHSFVGKTNMKNVSPGETFSCSLGVDVGVHLDYKPVKKYHEQIGLINKYSSTAYEQIIVIKNAHNEPVLVTVKEHIPRSTDERIKIRLIAPAVSCADIQNDNDDTISSVQFPKEGFKFDGSILDWTIPIQNGKSVELHIKWAMEHPRNETVHFVERN